ncbi:DUF4190 domain-containing protein [Gordonia terrae]
MDQRPNLSAGNEHSAPNAEGNPPPPPETSTLAVLALIGAFVFAPLGIVLGHLSLSEIKKTARPGRGLALAGLILGYLFTGFAVVAVVVTIALVTSVGSDLEMASPAREQNPSDMSVDQFSSLNRTQQIDYAGTKLNESTEADTALVLAQLTRTGWDDYNYFNRPIVDPGVANSPQEIWDQVTLGYAHIRNLASSGGPAVNEARKLAYGVAEGGAYTNLTDDLGTDGNYSEVAVAYTDQRTQPVKSSGEYYGVPSNGDPITSFVIEYLATPEFLQTRVVLRFVLGTEADANRWIVAKTIPL